MRPFHLARAILTLVLLAAPTLLHAENNNCNADTPLPTIHDFHPLPSDTIQPTHLELTRPFTGTGHLELSLCRADLHLRTRADLDHLRLLIDLHPSHNTHPLTDYIRRIDIQPGTATLTLPFPEDAHATVTVELPLHAGSSADISVGKGNLDLNTVTSAGDREINLGMGNLTLTTGGDHSYSSLEINIGMGTLHDSRPNGHNAHFVIARTDPGTGQGSLSLNVGMGTVDIRE